MFLLAPYLELICVDKTSIDSFLESFQALAWKKNISIDLSLRSFFTQRAFINSSFKLLSKSALAKSSSTIFLLVFLLK